MDDYISRQAAIDEVINLWADKPFGNPALVEIKDCIETLPSVEAEPVRHGRWMLCENQNQDDVDNGNYFHFALYVCSNCNHSDIHAKTAEVPFCWFCGAKMDEVTQ